MGSPHRLHLGFLLLALAASLPNIAMPTVCPTEMTEDSSSDSTAVAVFLCKDFKSCTCTSEENNFENFTKIAETQNKAFSDVVIKLVTNKTHITVCFEQENSCLERIYGIFWEKAEGSGLSCGILNPGSGENGRGNISTEEKSICCEAETDTWKRNPTLNCYTPKSCPKPTTLPVGIPGNLEFLTSKNNNTGTVLALLFVGVSAGLAILYYLWLRRCRAFRQDRRASDREKLAHV